MMANPQAAINLKLDTVAPFQYFRVFRAKAHFSPEERLMLAVLNDAVETLQRYHGSNRRRSRNLYQEAMEWISSTDDDAVFSFGNICDMLNLDANYLRQGLLRFVENRSEPVRRLKIWREPLRYRNRIRERYI